jgi:hypothetical protein
MRSGSLVAPLRASVDTAVSSSSPLRHAWANRSAAQALLDDAPRKTDLLVPGKTDQGPGVAVFKLSFGEQLLHRGAELEQPKEMGYCRAGSPGTVTHLGDAQPLRHQVLCRGGFFQ